MDRQKSRLNVSTSIVSRVLLLVAAFLVRRLLIQYIGNDVNGLNTLYTDIIGMLVVAELGVVAAVDRAFVRKAWVWKIGNLKMKHTDEQVG